MVWLLLIVLMFGCGRGQLPLAAYAGELLLNVEIEFLIVAPARIEWPDGTGEQTYDEIDMIGPQGSLQTVIKVTRLNQFQLEEGFEAAVFCRTQRGIKVTIIAESGCLQYTSEILDVTARERELRRTFKVGI